MVSELHERCSALVESLGLATANDIIAVKPLTGGVASDIAAVELGDRTICAKFALEKLRVAADWHAPVKRNAAEYAWLDVAGKAVEGVAPALYGRDPQANGFAMEFIEGDDIYLWKAALLAGQQPSGEARKVGAALGRIHAMSATADFNSDPFQNSADFYELRLEPYLEFTASMHPDLTSKIVGQIQSQQRISLTLVHGDVSPKNILFRDAEPVILDAECATMGDPSFDVAFCMNHLLLKAFHLPMQSATLLGEASAFWKEYSRNISWEKSMALQSRVAALLPALMLARIDGKSPVEYLSEKNRNRVREVARLLIAVVPMKLDDVFEAVQRALKERQR